jgi:hypothetical protein
LVGDLELDRLRDAVLDVVRAPVPLELREAVPV